MSYPDIENLKDEYDDPFIPYSVISFIVEEAEEEDLEHIIEICEKQIKYLKNPK